MASTRVVLPWSTWAMMATFRREGHPTIVARRRAAANPWHSCASESPPQRLERCRGVDVDQAVRAGRNVNHPLRVLRPAPSAPRRRAPPPAGPARPRARSPRGGRGARRGSGPRSSLPWASASSTARDRGLGHERVVDGVEQHGVDAQGFRRVEPRPHRGQHALGPALVHHDRDARRATPARAATRSACAPTTTIARRDVRAVEAARRDRGERLAARAGRAPSARPCAGPRRPPARSPRRAPRH